MGKGLIVIPLSTGIACELTINIKVIFEIVKQKYNKYKKRNENNQQTNNIFDKLHRKKLEDTIIDKSG